MKKKLIWTIAIVFGVLNVFVSGDGVVLRTHFPQDALIAVLDFLAGICLTWGAVGIVGELRGRK